MKPVVVTGANGFIGKNLVQRLVERQIPYRTVDHRVTPADLAAAVEDASAVIHLAGVNRPQVESEFDEGNHGLTKALVAAMENAGGAISVVYASSIQATRDNPYGRSKLAAEQALAGYGERTSSRVTVFRLANVFGKWSRPNYNSAVATFCHNVARSLPITVNDPAAPLSLVYVDDAVEALIGAALELGPSGFGEAGPVYSTTVGEVASIIESFKDSRDTLVTPEVGTGLTRALHSTYLSFLDTSAFDYPLVAHTDSRGTFVEMLKTPACGQFSYFTAHPGITRGGHYHHSKTEKFLVLQGEARFGFRHVLSGERFELRTTGATPRVVETVPGWAHDITNVGDGLMIVMLWANEVFDRQKPDTFAAEV